MGQNFDVSHDPAPSRDCRMIATRRFRSHLSDDHHVSNGRVWMNDRERESGDVLFVVLLEPLDQVVATRENSREYAGKVFFLFGNAI